jgi:hypothetical protein
VHYPAVVAGLVFCQSWLFFQQQQLQVWLNLFELVGSGQAYYAATDDHHIVGHTKNFAKVTNLAFALRFAQIPAFGLYQALQTVIKTIATVIFYHRLSSRR